jgi:hypothetical protein
METHKYPFVAGVITGAVEATINYPMCALSALVAAAR